MLNALKKLVSHDAAAGGQKGMPPAGMQTMGQNLQRRFAKGVQYNMKIIIKGDRNVGKSCLFYRLQGQKFKEEYLPTEEIQVASIQWNYKATDDIVKVEVWDVVDKGKKRKKIDGLKLENTVQENGDEPALDAEFINVYKGTHGVIMMLDITKQWTCDYVQRELPRVPPHLPVLVLANHRDMGHHRTVTEDQVRYYIENMERPPDSAQIRYAESSMRNGFGLKFLHKFFNLPFLQLQRETLQRQLETNSQEIDATNDELDVLQESDDQNYDFFLDSLTTRRRQFAEQLTGVCSPGDSGITSPSSQMNGITPSTSFSNFAAPPSSQSTASKSVPSTPSQPLAHPEMTMTRSPTVLPTPDASARNETTIPQVPSKQGSFMSRLFNRSAGQNANSNAHEEQQPTGTIITQNGLSNVTNVEEFVPEGLDQSFNSFLDDAAEADIDGNNAVESDSDDEDGGNPMVAGFQDFDPEDTSVLPKEDSDGGENETKVETITLPVPVSEDEMPHVTAVEVHTPPAQCSDESVPLADESRNSPPPPLYSLENEDLSFLERKYFSSSNKASSSAPSRSSPSTTTPEGSEIVSEDSTTGKLKKHKRKDKKKDEERSHRKSHKHKKHREKSGGENVRVKRSQEKGDSSDMDKLEEFLGSDTKVTKDLYESL